MTYRNKEICCNKFQKYFIAKNITVVVTYRNKNFGATNYNNKFFITIKYF